MADVHFKGSSDFQRVKKDYEELARKTAQVEQENRRLKATTEKAGKAQKDAYGQGAIRDLRAMAAGFFSIGAAVGVAKAAVKSYFDFVRAEMEKGFGSLNSRIDSERNLNQVATSNADLARLQSRSDAVAIKYGMDRQTSRNLMFSARSEGYEGSFEKVASFNQVIDPEVAGRLAGQVPGLFGGSVTPEQGLDVAYVAAKRSRTNVSEMARAFPTAAEGAAMAGSTLSETAALEGVLSSQFASPSTAADRIKAFGVKVSMNERLKGRGVVGAFDKLQNEFSPAERNKFLGESQELRSFYDKMQTQRDTVVQWRKDIDADMNLVGTGKSQLELARSRALLDPTMQAQRALAQNETQKELVAEKTALEKMGGVTSETNVVKNTRDLTYGRWAASKAAAYGRDYGLSGEAVNVFGMGSGAVTEGWGSVVAPRNIIDQTLRQFGSEGTGPLETRLVNGIVSGIGRELRQQTTELKSDGGGMSNSRHRLMLLQRNSEATE